MTPLKDDVVSLYINAVDACRSSAACSDLIEELEALRVSLEQVARLAKLRRTKFEITR